MELTIKYFILVFVGILSYFIFTIALFVGLGSLQILDATINLFCILLMSPMHFQYYMCFCKICHNKLQHIWLKKLNPNKNIDMMVAGQNDDNKQKAATIIGEPTAMTINSSNNTDPTLTETQNEGKNNAKLHHDINKDYAFSSNSSDINNNAIDVSFTSQIMAENDHIIQKNLAINEAIKHNITSGYDDKFETPK